MLLDDVRVLDLTDHRGEIGPWLLGILGAEVIKVEPRPGSSARREPPLLAAVPEGLRSLQFAAYNDGKRSIAIDPTQDEDRATLLDLVAGADLVFESGPPATISACGISEADLLAANDRLVHVLVTPFGHDGPRAEQPASELTLAALGGPMSLQGVRERAPVKVSVPQVWRHTGTEAAVAALVALRRMEICGEPQWVDVSAQCAMTWTMLNAMEADEVQGFDFQRSGMTLELAVTIPLRHLAKDGVTCTAPSGVTCGPIMPWLVEEGIAPPHWADQDWATYDHRFLSGDDVEPSYADLAAAIDELCSRYTRDELLVRGLQYGATLAPVNNVADLLAFEHLDRRDYWTRGSVPGGTASIRWPGAPVTIDGVRPVRSCTVPPLDEAADEIRHRPQRPRRDVVRRERGALPLEGIRVADFSWIGVGPITAKYLADHGADVVRIETERRLDTLRAQAPFKDAEFGINRSNFYGSFNTSKRSIAVDLAVPEGLDIAHRMTQWADVVIDSFRPGTMERFGLGGDQIHSTNPGAIVVTTSLLGGGGPLSPLAGYGYHAGALAGFTDLVGWPDLGPDGPWMAYTDTISPRFLAATILAALDRRDRTGQGCAIEGAQLELALHYLTPELLDHQISGFIPTRMGNRDPVLAPQGVYPCAGDDEWCAITVADDAQWAGLVEVMGSPGWASDSYAAVEGRRAAHDAIDAHISEWTAGRTATDVERLVWAAGIPAGKVQRTRDLRHDPQYVHRGFYARLDHSEVGVVPYAGHQFRIRGHEHGPRHAAPCLGEHTYEVLTTDLGMTDDEVAAAAVAGALT